MALSLFVPEDGFTETRVSLNNQIFYYILKWNTREGAWYFSLLDVNKNTLMEGRKVCRGVCLTKDLDNNPMDGNLYIYNTDSGLDDLGRNNLGQNKKYLLLYLTTAEEALYDW